MTQFGKLGKSVNGLFKKKYDFSNTISTKNVSGNVTVEAGATRGDNLTGYTTATLKDGKWGELECKLSTDSNADIPTGQLKLTKLAPGLEVTVKGSVSKVNVDAVLTKDAATLTAGVASSSKGTKITASGVISNDGLSVGGAVSLDATGNLTDYNVGTEWASKDLTVTLVTSDKGENITASCHQKLAGGSVLGAKYTLAPENNARSLTVGTKFNFDDRTLVQTKIGSCGTLSTVVEHRLSAINALLCVSTAHNTLASGSGVMRAKDLGVSLKLGEF